MNNNTIIEILSMEYLANTPDSKNYRQLTDKLDELLKPHYGIGVINDVLMDMADAVSEERHATYKAGFGDALKLILETIK